MNIVTVSPKFQVVIPLGIRKVFRMIPGEKLQVLSYENRIELVPIKKIRKMRGFIKGVKTDVPREGDRP